MAQDNLADPIITPSSVVTLSAALIANAVEAVRTCHSGASAPTVTSPYQLWADTTTDEMKMRNAADSAWIVVWDLVTGAGTNDADAIHDNAPGEISAISVKGSPIGADFLLIEDSADSDNKKHILISTLPTGLDTDAIHDNLPGEISAISVKGTPIGADFLLIEDSADSDNKKHVLISSLPSISMPVPDTTSIVEDVGDPTKEMRIDVGAVLTGTIRVLTMPDADIDLTPGTGTYVALAHGHTAAASGGTLASAATPTGIHDDVASEISALTEKVTPLSADHLIIESDADGNAKRRVQIGNLPVGADPNAIHDNVASEISAITLKGTPVGADFLVIEDSAAANVKKHILISSLPAGGEVNDLEADGAANIAIGEIYHGTGAGTGVYAKISAITEEATPASGDWLLGEEAGGLIRRFDIGNLPTGSDPDAIHDNVASEISAITLKASPVGADFLVIEDSAAANVKKHILISSLPGGAEVNDLESDGAAGIELDEMAVGTGSGTAVWQSINSAVFPVDDSVELVEAATAKRMRIDVGAITNFFTRVLSMPNQNIDLTPSGATGDFPSKTHDHSTSDLGGDIDPTTGLADFKGNSILLNDGTGAAAPQVADELDLATASPVGTDFILGWTAAGLLRKYLVSALPAGSEVNNLEVDGMADCLIDEIPVGTGTGTVGYVAATGAGTIVRSSMSIISDFTNANHDHSTNAEGGTITPFVQTGAILEHPGGFAQSLTIDLSGLTAFTPVTWTAPNVSIDLAVDGTGSYASEAEGNLAATAVQDGGDLSANTVAHTALADFVPESILLRESGTGAPSDSIFTDIAIPGTAGATDWVLGWTAAGLIARWDANDFLAGGAEVNDLESDGAANIENNEMIVGTGAGTAAYVASTGTGAPVRTTSPTIVTPTIASFANATHDHEAAAGGGTLGHNAATDNPTVAHGATGAVVGTTNTQTLQNKQYSNAVFTGTQITLDQLTEDYTLSWDDPAAARAISIPDPGGTDVFVFESMTQTLAGKTLTTPTIASFANATHDHADAAGGGQIDAVDLVAFKGNSILINDDTGALAPQVADELDIATATPVGADFLLGWTAAGLLRKYTVTSMPAGSEANDLESDGAAGIAIGEIYHGTGAGTGVYAKISAITEEATPASGDWLLGEEAGGLIRRFDIGNLPAGSETNTLSTICTGIASGEIPLGSGTNVATYTSRSGIDDTAVHDNVSGEINALTGVSITATDVLLIEDQSDTFNKKKILASGLLPPQNDALTAFFDTGDVTSQLRVDVGAIASVTTRVLTYPDENIDLTPGTGSFATAAEGDLAATALQPGDEVNDLETDGAAGIAINEIIIGTGAGTASYVDELTLTAASVTGSDFLVGWTAAGLLRRFAVTDLPAGSEVNNLAGDGISGIADNQLAVGTGAGTAEYRTLNTVGALTFSGTIFGQAAIADLSDVAASTGTGTTVVFDTSPTIVTPVIASFTTAQHDHEAGAGGGTLGHNAATDNPTVAHGATGAVVGTTNVQTLTNKTLTTPRFVNSGTIDNDSGEPYLQFTTSATPVNNLQLRQADTGQPVDIIAVGEANAALRLAGSGTGVVEILDPEIAATEWSAANHTHAGTTTGGQIAATALADFKGNSILINDGTGALPPQIADELDIATASPAGADFILGWTAAGLLRKYTVSSLPAGSEANDLVTDGTAGIALDDMVVGTGAGTAAYVASTGSGAPVRTTSPTIVTPVIVSFTTAQHDHEAGAGGGTLGHNAATDNPTVAHGATGAVVGTTNTQALTNKTLTTPIIVTGGAIHDAGGDPYLSFVEVAVPINRLQITQSTTSDPVIVASVGEVNAGMRLAGSGIGTVEIVGMEVGASSWSNATHTHAAASSGGTIPIANTTGTLTIARGGTGQTGDVAAFDALSPVTTAGDIIYRDATNNVRLAAGTAHQKFRMNAGATAPEWYSEEKEVRFTLEDPVSGDLFGFDLTNKAITVTEVQGICDNGTSVVVNVRRHTSIAAAGGTLIDQITPTTSLTSETTITAASVPADVVMFVELGTVTGSVDSLTIKVYYTED